MLAFCSARDLLCMLLTACAIPLFPAGITNRAAISNVVGEPSTDLMATVHVIIRAQPEGKLAGALPVG